jgi:hypothetical protein
MTTGEFDRLLWCLSGIVCEMECSCMIGACFRLLFRGLRLSNLLTSGLVFLKLSKIVCSRDCPYCFMDTNGDEFLFLAAYSGCQSPKLNVWVGGVNDRTFWSFALTLAKWFFCFPVIEALALRERDRLPPVQFMIMVVRKWQG